MQNFKINSFKDFFKEITYSAKKNAMYYYI